MSAIGEAIARVVDAWEDPGSPGLSRQLQERLHQSCWPTLARAVEALVAEVARARAPDVHALIVGGPYSGSQLILSRATAHIDLAVRGEATGAYELSPTGSKVLAAAGMGGWVVFVPQGTQPTDAAVLDTARRWLWNTGDDRD